MPVPGTLVARVFAMAKARGLAMSVEDDPEDGPWLYAIVRPLPFDPGDGLVLYAFIGQDAAQPGRCGKVEELTGPLTLEECERWLASYEG